MHCLLASSLNYLLEAITDTLLFRGLGSLLCFQIGFVFFFPGGKATVIAVSVN